MADIKKKLAAAKSPERKRALKAQLKAAKRIVALKKKLLEAPRALRALIKAKIAKAKVALKKATKNVVRVTRRVDAKRIAKLKSKIASARSPASKRALKTQLKAQKKVAELRKKLAAAKSPKAKAALKRQLKVAKAKLSKAAAKVKSLGGKRCKHCGQKLFAVKSN